MKSSENLENENIEAAEESVDANVADDKKAEQIIEAADESFEHADKAGNSSASSEVMLTTVDNPFDPFDEFDDWFRFDEEKGYHTCSYIGRIVQSDDEMSDEEFRKAMNNAVDEIIKYDFMNIYKKVVKPAEDDDSSSKEEGAELG